MKNKLLIIVSLYYISAIISCGCKESKTPYADFKSISIQDETWTENGWIQGSYLIIDQEDIEYISSNNINWFNSAFAFSKAGECTHGYLGNKFKITNINVTCNQIFYDTIPSGNSLNNVIHFSGINGAKINEIQDNIEVYNSSLYFIKNNLPNVDHLFTVTIEKSNGEILTAKSDLISWN